MINESPTTTGEIVSSFKGMYGRVARKLKVSPSMVSKVANRERISSEIDAALADELKQIEESLGMLRLTLESRNQPK